MTKGALNLVTGPGLEGRRRDRHEPGRQGDLVHRIGRRPAAGSRSRRRSAGRACSSRWAARTRRSCSPTRTSPTPSTSSSTPRSSRPASAAPRPPASSSRSRSSSAFTEALVARTQALKVGNGLEAGIDIGPSIDEKQLGDRAGLRRRRQPAKGAKLLCGGERLSERRARARLLLVAGGDDRRGARRCASRRRRSSVRCSAVLPARNLDHAIEIANGIRFGLSAGICTRSLTSRLRVHQPDRGGAGDGEPAVGRRRVPRAVRRVEGVVAWACASRAAWRSTSTASGRRLT